MATWHQMRAHGPAMANLYAPPTKGHKVVVNHPNALAYSQHYSRKREAQRFAKRTGGTLISALPHSSLFKAWQAAQEANTNG